MARIIVDIEVASIHETYEVVTDNQMDTVQFYEKVMDELRNKNINLAMLKDVKIYSKKDHAELDKMKTLGNNNVEGGDVLILV